MTQVLAAVWSPLYPLTAVPLGHVFSTIAIVIIAGLVMGSVARYLHLPSISGNILAGVLLGPIFGLVDTVTASRAAQLEPITELALSLIAISIGSHLKFRVLHNALKRIVLIVLVASLVMPLIVGGGLWALLSFGPSNVESPFLVALFLGLLAIATAPATAVHVIKESQAKGLFVKTLVAVIVLNNVANIALFEIAKTYLLEPSSTGNAVTVLLQLLSAVLLGATVAAVLIFLRDLIFCRQRNVTVSFGALFICYGVAVELGISAMIANLTLGIVVANFSDRNQILDSVEDFEEFLYAVFFTLTGTHADFSDLPLVGGITCAYLVLRFGANVASVKLTHCLTHLPERVNNYLAWAQTPQGGITIGLLVALESVEGATSAVGIITPVILAAVTVSEMIGPIFLRHAIRGSGEEGQGVPRLVDFIEEEFITVDLSATDKQQVIVELVDFLFKTHAITEVDKATFLQSVLDREKQASTGLGKGIAMPHGLIAEGPRIMGVMGIIREGIDWDAIDGKPVHMVILLATPVEQTAQHLKVMATLSRLFSRRTVKHRGLHEAKTPAQVYEAIADEEFESLNAVICEDST